MYIFNSKKYDIDFPVYSSSVPPSKIFFNLLIALLFILLTVDSYNFKISAVSFLVSSSLKSKKITACSISDRQFSAAL